MWHIHVKSHKWHDFSSLYKARKQTDECRHFIAFLIFVLFFLSLPFASHCTAADSLGLLLHSIPFFFFLSSFDYKFVFVLSPPSCLTSHPTATYIYSTVVRNCFVFKRMELLQIIQTTFSIAIASTRTQRRRGKLIAVDTQRTYPKTERHEDRFFFFFGCCFFFFCLCTFVCHSMVIWHPLLFIFIASLIYSSAPCFVN